MSLHAQGWGPPTLTGGLLESETERCELCAEFVFANLISSAVGFSSLPLHWASISFSFHHVRFCQIGLLLCLVSTSLGLSWGCFSQVKSESWHQIHLGSVQFPRFCLTAAEVWNSGPVLKLCYRSEFYLASKGKYTFEVQRQADPKGEAKSWLLFFYVFFFFFFFFSSFPWACLM